MGERVLLWTFAVDLVCKCLEVNRGGWRKRGRVPCKCVDVGRKISGAKEAFPVRLGGFAGRLELVLLRREHVLAAHEVVVAAFAVPEDR